MTYSLSNFIIEPKNKDIHLSHCEFKDGSKLFVWLGKSGNDDAVKISILDSHGNIIKYTISFPAKDDQPNYPYTTSLSGGCLIVWINNNPTEMKLLKIAPSSYSHLDKPITIYKNFSICKNSPAPLKAVEIINGDYAIILALQRLQDVEICDDILFALKKDDTLLKLISLESSKFNQPSIYYNNNNLLFGLSDHSNFLWGSIDYSIFLQSSSSVSDILLNAMVPAVQNDDKKFFQECALVGSDIAYTWESKNKYNKFQIEIDFAKVNTRGIVYDGTSIIIDKNDQQTSHYVKPSVVALKDGNFAFAYQKFNASNGENLGIYTKVFDMFENNFIGETIRVDDESNDEKFSLDGFDQIGLVPKDEGFSISWSSYNEENDNREIHYADFDAYGTKMLSIFKTSMQQDSINYGAYLAAGSLFFLSALSASMVYCRYHLPECREYYKYKLFGLCLEACGSFNSLDRAPLNEAKQLNEGQHNGYSSLASVEIVGEAESIV